MGRLIDMTGQRFGSWTVEGRGGKDKHGQALWLCLCDCGNRSEVPGGRLRRGESRSCGCQKGAACAAANIKHGASVRGRMTSEYRAWSNMIDRCERPGNKQYADWGGRGIKVCVRWRESFAAFLEDMGPRPSPSHTIDRVDNDGDYEPGNCRWATRREQGLNKRNNRSITADGETLYLAEWARRLGTHPSTIISRIKLGWSERRAVTTPITRRRSA